MSRREEPRHDPSTALAEHVRLRDRACDGIGCSVPATRCELDHQVPRPDGPTSAGNLTAHSQRCHHAKHTGWTVNPAPDGTSTWTNPGGHRYPVPSRADPPPPLPPDARLTTPDELDAQDRTHLTPPIDPPG